MNERVVVVDYGMGNIWSIRSALFHLGVEPLISNDPDIVASAEALILPGVGSFRKAMKVLNSSGLAEALAEAVLIHRRKILGICLGMQLLAQQGTEDGITDGLGLLPLSVDRFTPKDVGMLKVPHIGFNVVKVPTQTHLFEGLSSLPHFYFVHSYYLACCDLPGKAAICHYGIDFLAAYEYENIFATQFHPEKSQSNGLKLLSNFLKAKVDA